VAPALDEGEVGAVLAFVVVLLLPEGEAAFCPESSDPIAPERK
jgi:hypothetical protein